MITRYFLLSLLFFIHLFPAKSQEIDTLDRSRLKKFAIVTSASYATGMLILNQVWYKDFERTSFHFFDDSKEWNKLDKFGHSWTSYHLTRATDVYFQRSGLSPEKSFWFASLSSFILLTPIEVLDGYSEAYGASIYDMGANLTGSLLYGFNYLILPEPILNIKFSFSRSNYAEIRPELLGKNFAQQILKDYNGQTYWLTFNLHPIVGKVPEWLHLALGYGADEMVHANESANRTNGYNSYRQWYLSFDLHLPSLISSRRPWVNSLIQTINMIHLPAPAIELSKSGNTFHILKF